MEVICRGEARSKGLHTYFTGCPCPHGHVAYRYTRNGKCSECAKQWQKENRESAQAAVRRYHEANKEKVNLRKRQHHVENKDAINARKREGYRADPAKSRERNREWYLRNVEINRAKVRARSKHMKHATPSWVNKDELLEIYMKCPPGHQVDHFVPVRGVTPDGRKVSGLHVPWNLRYLPAELNSGRNNRLTLEDLAEIEADTDRRFHALIGSILEPTT